MFTPTTASHALLALGIAGLLLGLWGNAFKAANKWRYELFSFDFALGVLLTAVLLAFTAGNVASGNTFTVDDNLMVAGKRQFAMAIAAGFLLQLANLLLFAGTSLAGLSAGPIAGAAMAFLLHLVYAVATGAGRISGLATGAGLSLAALALTGMAQSVNATANPRKKGMHLGIKGFILATIGGLLLPAHSFVFAAATAGDLGVGAYTAMLFASIGVLLCTLLANVFLMNLPVQGNAISFGEYLRGTKGQHLLGIVGGLLWTCGILGYLLAQTATGAGATPVFRQAMVWPLGAFVAAVCGLTLWKESETWPTQAKLLGGLAVLLTLGAVIAVHVAG